MEIVIGKEVNYSVAKVKINNIIVNKNGEKVTVVVPYAWVDATGKAIRNGTEVYTEAKLQIMLATAFSPLKNAMVALIDSNSNLSITLGTTIVASVGKSATINNKQQWITTPVTNEQFVAALVANGLSLNAFNSIVNGIGQSIFA